MPHHYALTLTTPPAYAEGRTDPGDLPDGLPARFPDAAPVVNFGLLAGEAAGADIAPAVELLDEVNAAARLRRETDPDAVRLLSGDDLPVLAEAFAGAAAALRPALDEAGRPAGPAGARLLASEHVALDGAGRAVVGTRELPAADLADGLDALARFLGAAAERGLYVVME